MKRCAAVDPGIGHVKAEHRVSRIYLRGALATEPTPCSSPPVNNFGLLSWLVTLYALSSGRSTGCRWALSLGKTPAQRFFRDDQVFTKRLGAFRI
jgi:hypothetical protein